MSKKILKRSLALGALMAFVITGNAWAATGADESKITGNPINERITNFVSVDTLDGTTDGIVKNQKFTGIDTNGTTGGVFAVYDAAKFDNCIFSGNKLTNSNANDGGVFYVGSNGDLSITNSTVKNNYIESSGSSARGAFISNGNGKVTIDNVIIETNLSKGNKKNYGSVIHCSTGSVTNIFNTDFQNKSSSFKDEDGNKYSNNATNTIFMNGGTLNLKNVTFSGWGISNFINGQENGGTETNRINISGTENTFGYAMGKALWNKGILTFEEDSKTTFSGGTEILNQNEKLIGGAVVNLERGSVVNMLNGIEGAGTVNINGGTLNGKINGSNEVVFSGSSSGSQSLNRASTNVVGTWKLNGDSVVSGIVVNDDAVIDGAKANGKNSSLTIDRNLTKANEYAIHHTSGDLTLKNVILRNIKKESEYDGINGKYAYGSVLYSINGANGKVGIYDSEIINNINKGNSNYRYGVMHVTGNDLDIIGSTVSNNESSYMGGALLFSSANLKIENSIFDSNIAGTEGGAFVTNNGDVTITNSTFSNNEAKKQSGGAINIQGTTGKGKVTLNGNNNFTGNKAAQSGGAIKIYKYYNDKEGKTYYSILDINGTANFSDNTANGVANDINNEGIVNINKGAIAKLMSGIDGSGTTNIYGGILELGGNNRIGILKVSDGGKIAFGEKGHLDVDEIDESSDIVTITMVGKDADDLNTKEQLTTVAERMGVAATYKETDKVKVVMAAGEIVGKTTGDVVFETQGIGADTYYHGVVKNVVEAPNPANEAISDTGISMKLHWRTHVNDMNKRMGELRDANGEHGVWTRMVRGESEYKNTKAQYNQYQLGYDEKLSVDKRWTVGAAVTFSEGDASYGYGSTEDKSTAFAIYGSKLNNDGTFVDLIARYAHLESDVDDQAGTGSYSANGMSVSAEFGKRIQQGNGLWIEPQAELTYGTIDSAEYKLGTKTVEVGDMDSLIGRIGFRIGKDIEKGNVYARASYLYDFEGEAENAFRNDTARRSFNEDLGGGWWEVGVGANINLSKATYVYADIEKTFGGEVDTNWQWNLGVRYSF